VLMIAVGGGGAWAYQAGLLDPWLPGLAKRQVLAESTPPQDSSMAGDTTAALVANDSLEAGDSAFARPVPPPVVEAPEPESPSTRQAQRPPPTNRSRPAEREPEPVPPQVGFLRVLAEPYGDVFVDDRFVGTVPVVDYELSPGKHAVKITRDGCRDIVDTVTVAAGQRAVVNRVFRCES
jgi:PEGA domain